MDEAALAEGTLRFRSFVVATGPTLVGSGEISLADLLAAVNGSVATPFTPAEAEVVLRQMENMNLLNYADETIFTV